ncbi:hypothetical protein PHYBLDRAFT_138238 [Phycomyces blakesleeanus NRRL 1555(-)]|uniref:Galactose oxidase n=2 Tax=Phycomyces blakesleeanus TaxID=4837 RepID=A0A163BCS5_PHYB8|nr:hypothetical protein PHYBLDRAFT_138238 [Phycomyces blakesleeanus NRRL 1555(-)]OAD80691.1 hypothetical protein PHYBLDRAFT_138238 [Phycomyces blakesleeanus NRRL 1555(-)]|eukprot:XP_018298731.1 hypothetical protein PHYBLDRAFT_138238 [Phycomyces blakesleeanus NRRL 1555(-)]
MLTALPFFVYLGTMTVFGKTIGGRAVYVPSSNAIWIFSASRSSQTGNTLFSIDLGKSFNAISAPMQVNKNCPILHFTSIFRGYDDTSINIIGVGSYTNSTFAPNMVLCQYDTKSGEWSRIVSPNEPIARRNYAGVMTTSSQTIFWGGDSDMLTGLPQDNFIWRSDIAIWDAANGWIPSISPYSGMARTNATITQISDTNGRLVILGGSVITNSSWDDRVTNFPLASMADIILYDPRTQLWENVVASGNIPSERKHHTATLHPDGRTIILFGGEAWNNSTGPYLLNDLNLLDTTTWTWRSYSNTSGTALYRSNHTSIVIGHQMFVIAGSNATDKAVDIQILELDSWTWTYQSVAIPAPSRWANIGGVSGLVGIIVGCVVLVTASLLGFFWWWSFRQRRQKLAKDAIKETIDNNSNRNNNNTSNAFARPGTPKRSKAAQESTITPTPVPSWGFYRGSNMPLSAPSPASPVISYTSELLYQNHANDDGLPYWEAESYYPTRDRIPSFFLLPIHDTLQKPNLVEDNETL